MYYLVLYISVARVSIQRSLTDVVDELLDLALHAPVAELDLAQFVSAHDGPSTGQRSRLTLPAQRDRLKPSDAADSVFRVRLTQQAPGSSLSLCPTSLSRAASAGGVVAYAGCP